MACSFLEDRCQTGEDKLCIQQSENLEDQGKTGSTLYVKPLT